MKHSLGILSSLAVLAALCACEVSYKAQDDAMYYTDRAIGQYQKVKHYAHSRFNKNYQPTGDNLRLHLSNFDTFICDGARQLVANFDRNERTVSVSFDRKNKYLTRDNPVFPFSDGIYDLFVMEDGTLLVQKDDATILQHCRPLVADAMRGEVFTGNQPVDITYDYTPTISPADYLAADKTFNKSMSK